MSKPAARIGDMHTCPLSDGPKPHVGGPVSGPGVPLVLIGGVPAAVVGDMCVCVGPPDSIVQGSTGVFIGGKPAARMGDMTAHGGVIVQGFPMVLIGEMGSAAMELIAKKERYEARLTLIETARENASKKLPLEQKRILAAANRLELNNKSIERARLSDHIYGIPFGNPEKGNSDPPPPTGWKVLDKKKDPNSGLVYAVYESEYENPSKPVLVFRGTDNKDEFIKDWSTNGKQALGVEPDQYAESVRLGKRLSRKYPQGFEIAGHSKAGGQAALVGTVTGQKTYTFDASGVHDYTLDKYGKSRSYANQNEEVPLVEAFNFEHDFLSNAQDKGVPFLKGLSQVVPSSVIKSIGQLLILTGAGPTAIGSRTVLPSVDEDGDKIPFNPMKWIDYHGVSFIIDSMEYQKKTDAEILKKI